MRVLANTHMQDNQDGVLHGGGVAEGQDEPHRAPDAEEDEDDGDEDQLLVRYGGAGLEGRGSREDGPVLRERGMLWGAGRDKD